MSGETVLIVDDSSDIKTFLQEYVLLPRGYRVLTANDGQSGLKKATEHTPDLIMLDMSMPRMTGLEMLTALRQTDCQAPVIFMTMHGSESVAAEVFRLGVRDYLSKPFTVEEVEQAIERALQETRLKKEKEALQRNLVAAETIRQTIVTLSHYVNNSLMVLNNSLPLVYQAVEQHANGDSELLKLVQACYHSAAKIEAVMTVLRKVSDVQAVTYHGEITMIDIEQALKEELARQYEQKRQTPPLAHK
ncbi:MAG: response regulator [Anaerolineae bacterium]